MRWIAGALFLSLSSVGCSVVSSLDDYRTTQSEAIPPPLRGELEEPGGGPALPIDAMSGDGERATTTPADGTRSADVSAAPPCAPVAYYRDADGDGFGAPAKAGEACAPPPGYVRNSADCNDNDARVHPGQTSFFETPFMTAAGPSFDYDCSGSEEEDTQQTKGRCDPTCALGYAPQFEKRSIAGASAWCGSTNVVAICERTCATKAVGEPLRCR